MKLNLIRSTWLGIMCFAILIAIACSDVTPENYNRLKIGMSYASVVDLLGKPDSCDGAVGFKTCTWGDKEQYINVKFGGDSVVFFSSKGI